MTAAQKQWSLLAVAVIATAGYAAAVSLALTSLSPASAAAVIVLAAVPWAALIAGIASLLNRSQLAALVAAIALSTVSAGWFQPEAAAAALLVSLLAAAAARRIQGEMKNRIRYVVWHIYYRPVQLFLLAAVLIAAGPAFDRLQQHISASGLRLPEPSLENAAQPLERYLAVIIPGYSNDATIEDVVTRQLQQAGETRPLTEAERRQIERELQERLGQPVSVSQQLPTVIARSINGYITRFSQQSPLLSALIVIALAALAVRTALPLLAWPALGLIWLLAALARRWHIIYRIVEQQAVERLVLTSPEE